MPLAKCPIPIFPLVTRGSVAYVKLVPISGVPPAAGPLKPRLAAAMLIFGWWLLRMLSQAEMIPKLKFFPKYNYFLSASTEFYSKRIP